MLRALGFRRALALLPLAVACSAPVVAQPSARKGDEETTPGNDTETDTADAGKSNSSTKDPAVEDPARGKVGASQLVTKTTLANYQQLAVVGSDNETKLLRGIRLFLSDQSNNTCTNVRYNGAVMLGIVIPGENLNAGAITVVDGLLSSPNEGQALVTFNSLDAQCKDIEQQVASSGTVILTAVGSRITGSVDAKFPSGSVKGYFDAEVCPEGDAGYAAFCTP